MSMISAALLRLRLITRYAELRRSLERIVGSRDQASAALHETWLRLDVAKPASPVLNPDAYLLRMAARIATDDWRRNRELLGDDEREALLLHVVDETADPQRIVAARRDVRTLEAAMDELPPRQRAILAAARVDGLLNAEIAERFQISVAMVKKELAAAMRHCRERLAGTEAVANGDLVGRRKF
ncbi:RNA polymerase sigma factor [Achromobacter marplatensis]|uniref:Sigma-70 family RNA polymerase sigma factor n=1 Tax=Achromobacter marplatensis TaxID=470868 RepID=A0AA42WI88_9BURK|nr:sigma-70 family RNA polymerase sigma factor [Achromobacter marplatensis]MDH2054337.1 sigma-70 family RNA polymerase sigma factor [Achromobacter marplatensis]